MLQGFQAGVGAIGTITSSYYQGRANKYNILSNNYYNISRQASQASAVYQQIGQQIRNRIEQQAMSQLNQGIDITQGTAEYVRRHTAEMGQNKINEIHNNLNIEIYNSLQVSRAQANNVFKSNVAMGIAQGLGQVFNTYSNNFLYNSINDNTPPETPFKTNSNTNENIINLNDFKNIDTPDTSNLKLNLYDNKKETPLKTNTNTNQKINWRWWDDNNYIGDAPLKKKNNKYYKSNGEIYNLY